MARGPFTGQGTDTTGITLAFRRIIHQSAGGAAPVRQERFLTTAAAFVQKGEMKKFLRLKGRKIPGISTIIPAREPLSATGSF